MAQPQTRFGALHLTILGLTIAAALVHLTLSFPDAMFILNGLGYLMLLAALFLPLAALTAYRARVRWVLVAFTAATILGWLAIGERSLLGFATTAAEVVLAILLVLDARRR